MTCRSAAADLVVVHAGEVVVDERIIVDELDRAGERHNRARLRAKTVRRRQAKERAISFPAAENAVTHGLEEKRVPAGENALELPLDRPLVTFKSLFDGHGFMSIMLWPGT
jgi:hypothetical protein